MVMVESGVTKLYVVDFDTEWSGKIRKVARHYGLSKTRVRRIAGKSEFIGDEDSRPAGLKEFNRIIDGFERGLVHQRYGRDAGDLVRNHKGLSGREAERHGTAVSPTPSAPSTPRDTTVVSVRADDPPDERPTYAAPTDRYAMAAIAATERKHQPHQLGA